jgi:hypothetical protein
MGLRVHPYIPSVVRPESLSIFHYPITEKLISGKLFLNGYLSVREGTHAVLALF